MILAVCESFHAVTSCVSYTPAGFRVFAMIITTITFPVGCLGLSPLSRLHHSLG